ncbi:DUF1715-domain-containing protein [Thozetella sp. PMI_491]|nr:DUF1715-domain-containing protein [Thozetella sp. PMI_491]
MAEDPFEDVLNLEDQFYQEGYKQGTEDGIKAGRIEGRSFGLEKGFEKFVESGRLYGRAIVWANRLPRPAQQSDNARPESRPNQNIEAPESTPPSGSTQKLPPLPKNPRLEKHITTLYALVESESLATDNTDEAVNDFDDRFKRAQGKAKIIEKMIGEGSLKDEAQPKPGAGIAAGPGGGEI